MDDTRTAFLALNEAILLLAAERAGADDGADASVVFDLPLLVRADLSSNEIVVSQRDSGRELYRLPRP